MLTAADDMPLICPYYNNKINMYCLSQFSVITLKPLIASFCVAENNMDMACFLSNVEQLRLKRKRFNKK